MAFEKVTREWPVSPRANVVRLRNVHAAGLFHLSVGAIRAMGLPRRIDVWIDRETGTLALEPNPDGMSAITRSASATYQFTFTHLARIFREYNVRAVIGELRDGRLVFDLTAPSERQEAAS